MTESVSPKEHYRPEIDGLRALAVLLVVIFHAWPQALSRGFIGVDVFFVISGYLITRNIWSSLENRSFSLGAFYERRIRRILPALLAMLVIVTVLSWKYLLPDDFSDYGKTLSAATLSCSNILFGRQVDYFGQISNAKPLLHTWSLGVEEQFYLLFPLLLLVFHRFSRRMIVALLVLLTLSSVSLFILLKEVNGAFYWAHLRAWELLFGALVVLIPFPEVQSRGWREALCLSGFVAMIIPNLLSSISSVHASLMACLGAVLIIHLTGTKPTAIRRALSWGPLVGIGLISYSVYLWHWPFLSFAHYLSTEAPSNAVLLSCIVATFIVAYVSWKAIEQPCRKKFHLPRGRLFALTGALLVTFAALGYQASHVADTPSAVAQLSAGAWDIDSLRSLASVDPRGREVRLGSGIPPETVLWGDSHASALAHGIGSSAARHGQSIRFLGMHGVPPILGLRVKQEKGQRFNEQVITFIEQSDTTRTVILAARWAAYFVPSHPGGTDDIVSHSEPGLSPEELFTNRLQGTIDRLAVIRKRVVLVYPIPVFGVDVPRVAALLARQGKDPSLLVLSASKFDRCQSMIIRVLDKMKGPIIRIRPDRILLGENGYRAVVGGKTLYSDDDHLNRHGSAYVSPVFDQIFENKPRPIPQLLDQNDSASGDVEFTAPADMSHR
jgi:peptidoglycan/LPS O-acetylase OafA/YrhL